MMVIDVPLVTLTTAAGAGTTHGARQSLDAVHHFPTVVSCVAERRACSLVTVPGATAAHELCVHKC